MLRGACVLGVTVSVCAGPVSGQVLENFDHGNEALWAQQTGVDNLTLAPSGALGCGAGAEFAATALATSEGWRTRFNIATSPGNRYIAFVRFQGPTAAGRVHLGVGASNAGAWSAVLAGDTGELILQNNAGYGAIDEQTVAFAPAVNTWYALALDWQRKGEMTARLYDAAMGTLLAQTATEATGLIAVGGLAIRGFGGAGGNADLDEITQAVVLDSFDHGNESLWTQQTPGDNFSVSSAAAHQSGMGGAFGAAPAGFRTRMDLVTQPGRRYSAFVRIAGAGAPAGRVSLGVGAGAGGAWSAVFAADTAQVLLENNTGYGFVTVGAASFTAAINTWYRLELEWRANGVMIARLLDESGKLVLARTPNVATGYTAAGGVSIRGVATGALTGHIDDVTQAPCIEDFEHGQEALYAQQTAGDNMGVTARAARTGAFGAEFFPGSIGWRTRLDLPTSPGHQYRAFVRAAGPAAGGGRMYFAVGATSAGAWSAVFAPNTSEILLQSNTGYSFADVASAPFTPAPDTWYILALDWRRDGRMRVKIYNDTGQQLLAQTAAVNTSYTTAGGLALRGFAVDAGNYQDVDDIGATAHPPCYPDCNGDGALTVADFGCFQTRFVQGVCYADCNGDGVLTVQDFGCYQTRFVLGCP